MRKVGVFLLMIVLVLCGCVTNNRQDLVSTEPVFDSSGKLKIIIASDLHYLTPELYSHENETFMKMVRYADGKMMHYSEEIINAFIDDVINQKPDVLILSGDLTFNGERLSHEALASKLKRVKEHGIRVFVIPGNHDFAQYTAYDYSKPGDEYTKAENTTLETFVSIYQAYGYQNYAAIDETSLSYRVILNDKIQLLFIDVNGNEKENQVSDATLDWIETQLVEAQRVSSEVIVISHQNLLSHTEVFRNGFTISNYEALQSLFSTYGVTLGFSGHLHIQDIAESSGFYDIASSSLAVLDHQYGVLELNEDGSKVYQTQKVPVSLPDDSVAFFNTISYWKGVESLMGDVYDEKQKEAMIDFLITVNEHYFRGDLVVYREQLKETEGYELWLNMKGNTFGNYLNNLMNQPMRDGNHLILK